MTDETQQNDDEELKAVELENLKNQATMLGVQFHPSIGVEKLREKIKAKREELSTESAPKSSITKLENVPKAESANARRVRLKKEAGALVRIRVVCMNPNKTDIVGEIFTVSNAVVGTFKKYVPFNAEEGWHVPNIIYKMIKARKCQVFVKVRAANGQSTKRAKIINEFAVEVLPPLSQGELKDLAQRQAMASGGGI